MAYAKDTSVSVDKTEGEIKATLRRYKAEGIATFEDAQMAVVAFQMGGRRITMRLPLPSRDAKEFALTPSGKWARSEAEQLKAWEQACRSRWRAFYLCIKAKLESVEAGIETLEQAFLAHVQMPDGLTVSEHVTERIASAYQTGTMQPLIPGPRK